jgi:hypothetical protein
MEIINTTLYTRDVVLAFQRFNARLAKKLPWSTYAIFGILFAMLIAGFVFSIVIRGWIYLGIIALGMFVFGRRFYFLYIGPARKFDKATFKDLDQNYVFRKQGFSVTAGETEMKRHYEDVRAAYETPDAFYLYFSKGRAFIVSKTGFTQGCSEDLRKRLLENLGAAHYVIIKR